MGYDYAAGEKVKISHSKKAIWWEIIGVRKPFKSLPNKIFLILKHGKTIRKNIEPSKVCQVKK